MCGALCKRDYEILIADDLVLTLSARPKGTSRVLE